MSSYMVSEKEAAILAIASIIPSYKREFYVPKDLNVRETTLLLLQDNERSVNARYNTQDFPYGIATSSCLILDYSTLLEEYNKLSIVELLKLTRHMMYQCMDFDEWKGSYTFRRLHELQDKLVTKLPGYEEASWGIA